LHVGYGRPERRGARRAYLLPYGVAYRSFPLEIFETALLAGLAEVRAADVVGREDDGVTLLAGRVAHARQLIEGTLRDLEEQGPSAVLYRLVRDREAALRTLTKQLAEAERRAATSVRADWAEARTLLQFTETDGDRRRLRAALRRVLERVVCAFSPFHGREKVALVATVFRSMAPGGHSRCWVIRHTRATRAEPATARVESYPGVTFGGLSDPREVAAFARGLEEVCRREPGAAAFTFTFPPARRAVASD
jgi:hypothetical protein